MVNIPGNFPKGETEYPCICGETENMGHIYNCEILSERKTQILKYEKIFDGTMDQQIEVLRNIKQNLEKRELLKEK